MIGVISLLMALLLPAVQSAREAARRIECANHLKQLGLATHAYHDLHGMLPLGDDHRPSNVWGGWDYNAGVFARLLPQLEQSPLFQRIDFNESLYSSRNAFVFDPLLPVLHCPSDPAEARSDFDPGDLDPVYPDAFRVAFTNYVASIGPRHYYGGSFDPTPPKRYYEGLFWEGESNVRFGEVTDGLSNTMLFSERARQPIPEEVRKWWGWWPSGWPGDSMFVTYVPINAAFEVETVADDADLGRVGGCSSSFHRGGAQFCFADGSVRFLSQSIDSWHLTNDEIHALWDQNVVTQPPRLYQWLSTRAGGEVTGEF